MNKQPQPHKLPRIMGILNLTEDSFSDGGNFLDPNIALAHLDRMVEDGAEIIDIGAESTRPGAHPIALETELTRILPILKAIITRYPHIICSIDTRKAEVAKQCIDLGAQIINDVSAFRYDPAMIQILAANPAVKAIIMHMKGEPETMQQDPQYTDVISEVDEFFAWRIAFCISKGIRKENLMLDPGIGFGKNLEHNLILISHLDAFAHFELPLVLGASRKRFIAAIDPSEPANRLGGSLATAAWGIIKGASIIRVHDVSEHRQFLKVFAALATLEKVD